MKRFACSIAFAHLVVLGLISGDAFAETAAAHGCNCTSSDEGLVNGFFARALLTDDENWQTKWNTPSNQLVQFNRAQFAEQGDTVNLLLFFANAKLHGEKVDIECDLKILKPDGKIEVAPPARCFSEAVVGNVENLRLAAFRVEMKVDEADPKGLWTFEVGVRDVLRGVRIPLEVSLMVDSAAKVLQ